MPPSNLGSDRDAAPANVKSAARVLSIFEYFEKKRTPRTLSEISSDLNYPVSSALALLRSVHSMGYLTYDHESKAYFPNIRFAMLGQWVHDRLLEDGPVIEMMEHLAAATRETVLLTIRSGLHAQHIHVVHTPQSLSYHPPVGTLRPILRAASGRVLLCDQPDERIRKVVERTISLRIDPDHIYDAGAVIADLRRVRAQGYAFTENSFVQGAALVAVALPPGAADVPMAISVGGPSSRVDESHIPALVALIRDTIVEFTPKDEQQ